VKAVQAGVVAVRVRGEAVQHGLALVVAGLGVGAGLAEQAGALVEAEAAGDGAPQGCG
jgi:hypothetical protein